jgi:hypothetical protein
MDVVEVVLSWEATVLTVKQVRAGGALTLGEKGDLLLPAEILGDDRFEIVRYGDDLASVSVPQGAKLRIDGQDRSEHALELERGRVVEIAIGLFAVKLSLVSEERCRPAPPLDGLRRSGAGFVAGSALFHAAAFAVVALFARSLGATEEDPFDADRMALLQRMLDASAQREAERPPDDRSVSPSGGQASREGRPADDAEGAMGRPDTSHAGRWAARGTARPEDATLARERQLAEAQSFAAVGVLAAAFANDPDAPVVPWGTALDGSDAVSKMGALFGGSIDDAQGAGGLGLHGLEQGGGGTAHALGLDGLDELGHASGGCDGPRGCNGHGHGIGLLAGGHPAVHIRVRETTPEVNGVIDAEVIRRVVRMNSGRFRACYETGLRTNPGLEGRVTVKFVIDRSGAVAIAADGGSDIPDEAVRRCVVSSFLSLSFPSPDRGRVTVVYPIVFSPE